MPRVTQLVSRRARAQLNSVFWDLGSNTALYHNSTSHPLLCGHDGRNSPLSCDYKLKEKVQVPKDCPSWGSTSQLQDHQALCTLCSAPEHVHTDHSVHGVSWHCLILWSCIGPRVTKCPFYSVSPLNTQAHFVPLLKSKC